MEKAIKNRKVPKIELKGYEIYYFMMGNEKNLKECQYSDPEGYNFFRLEPNEEQKSVIGLAKFGYTDYQIAYVLDLDYDYVFYTYTDTIEQNLPQDYMRRRVKKFKKMYPESTKHIKLSDYPIHRKEKTKKVITSSMAGQIYKRLTEKENHKLDKPFNILGYTPRELMTHLESLFTEGMTWDNKGEWQIDHIKPISLFNYTTTSCQEYKQCWDISNLQPLWAIDNARKGNKWGG